MKELSNLKRLMKENGLIANTGNAADNLEIIPFRNLIGPGFTRPEERPPTDCTEQCADGCAEGCQASCKDGCKLGCKDGYL